MNIKKKYTLKYIKRNTLLLVILIAITFFAVILDTLIANHRISLYDFKVILLFSAIYLIIGMIPLFISFIYIFRFYKTISIQEKEYNTVFNNNNETILSKGCLNYLTDEWFIQAGSLAIYYKNIKSLNIKKRGAANHTRYLIVFKTNDGKKYQVHIQSSAHYTKIRKWWNSLKEKENN
ncbi:MAG: hypothetical protein IJO27_03340 [Bacilli bacterium]|nr:hypothetical protein [Bacilli bacterium]